MPRVIYIYIYRRRGIENISDKKDIPVFFCFLAMVLLRSSLFEEAATFCSRLHIAKVLRGGACDRGVRDRKKNCSSGAHNGFIDVINSVLF